MPPIPGEIVVALNAEGVLDDLQGVHRKAAVRSHFDGYPIALHGRLYRNAPNQG
jgi:hypothetical protein